MKHARIVTVSFVALFAVGVAYADIASVGYVSDITGQRADLETKTKDNLVAAINELNTEVDGKISSVAATETGTGNVVTSISASGNTVTANKGFSAQPKSTVGLAVGTAAGGWQSLSGGNNISVSDTGVISATGLQKALTAGTNITIDEATGTISATDTKYTAGTNVTISNGTISAKDTTYTVGSGTGLSMTGTQIDAVDATATVKGVVKVDAALSSTSANPVQNKVINTALGNKQNKLTAGSNITIDDATGTISATDTKYTAGTNVTISNGTISATDTKYTVGSGTGLSMTGTQIDAVDATATVKGVVKVDAALSSTSANPVQNKAINTALSGKQNKLTAGSNITIDEATGTISATDTKYTAGTNVTISNGTISATDTKYTASNGVEIATGNVIKGVAATRSSAGVSALGVIPSGATGTATAKIWVE